MNFTGFPSIPRLFRDIVITEKLDGTNAQVHVSEDGVVTAGSRNRWITPENDNYGFAAWVRDNTDELRLLGPGSHFGEWWGSGIQRRYGLTEKRFSLFNIARWGTDRPQCCHVVPVLYMGRFDYSIIEDVADDLRDRGSYAASGFMNPEGICIYHAAAKQYFKFTFGGDGHKSQQQ